MDGMNLALTIIALVLFVFWAVKRQTRYVKETFSKIKKKVGPNVLLIYPECPKKTFWGFYYALKFIRKRAAFPPLGLITAAAMLPKNWNLKLIDLNIEKLGNKDLVWTDYAFISAMNIQRKSVDEVISRCKKAGVTVIAGGPLFTAEYENFAEVDHFVLNEAELTLPLFLADLEKECAKRIYQTTKFCDIRKTPLPMWELIDLKHYAYLCIQFSRGCPKGCEFCNVAALFGKKPRTKTAAQIINELDILYHNLGCRKNVFFVDDNLMGDKRQFKTEILLALIEWRKGKGGMCFNTEISIDLADDPELMNLMVEAGFNCVFVGIETPSLEGLAECNKMQNLNRDLVKSIKRIQQSGLQVQGGFIVGFDSDKPSIFQKQIELIHNSAIVVAMVGILQAPHGTPLYERMQKAGRLLSEMSGNNVDGSTNIITKMDPAILQKGYKYILDHIYSPREYYQRIRNFLEGYRIPKIKESLTLDRIHALVRSIFYLGIWDKGRKYYWKLLCWSLFRRREVFPLAVTYAIYGYHLRRIGGRL